MYRTRMYYQKLINFADKNRDFFDRLYQCNVFFCIFALFFIGNELKIEEKRQNVE